MTPPTPWDGRVDAAIREVLDPCSCVAGSPINIVELGLVREVEIGEAVRVVMGLTDPMCMYFIDMADEIRRRVRETGWPGEVLVEWDTEADWSPDLVSPDGRLKLVAHREARFSRAGIQPYDFSRDAG